MTRIGVIGNPASQKNRKGYAGLRELLRRRPEVHYGELCDMAALPDILREFGALGVDLLVVSGGDGTVQAVMTEVMEGGHFGERPKLAISPRGMTNMIAGDVGLKNASTRALARLLDYAGQDDLQPFVLKRPTLRLEAVPGRPVRHGMFFGTAGIYRAIEACRRAVHPMKIETSLAVGVTFAGLAVQWLLGIGRDKGVFRGDRIGVRFDGGTCSQGEYMALLVTTLDRLILASRPYWGGGSGDLKYTSIVYPPRGLAGSTYRLLYGDEQRNLSADYRSQKVDRVSLSMSCPFTLDGELFEARPEEPVVLSSGGYLEFVRV